MLGCLLLAAAGDPSGPPPALAEREFEARVAAASARGDRDALGAVLAEGKELLPALLDRWSLAALAHEPGDRESLERVERLAVAAGIDPPALHRIPRERLPEWREALARYRTAEDAPALRALLGAFESLGDARRAALVRLGLGRILGADQEGKEATDFVSAARRWAEGANDAALLGFALETEGQVLRDLQRGAEAVEASRRALSIHRRLGDRRGEAEDERGIAVARSWLALGTERSDREAAAAEWREAEARFTRAAEIHEAIGEEGLRAKALRGRAGVRAHLGDEEGSRRDFEAAIEVFQRRGEVVEAAAVHSGFYESFKETASREAFDHLVRSAESFATAGAKTRLAAQTFRSYAEALEGRARVEDAPLPDALRYVRLASEIDERRGKPGVLAQDLHLEARLLLRSGDLESAERAARRALELQPPDADPEGRRADTLLTLADLADRRGSYGEERALLEAALEKAREAGNPDLLCPILTRFGCLLAHVGDRPRGRECLREASRLQPRSLRSRLDALLALAPLLSEEGDDEGAARHLEEAVERAREGGLADLEGRAFACCAALERQTHPGRARESIASARRAFGEAIGPGIRAYLAWLEGEVALAASEFEASAAAFRSALEVARDSKLRAACLCALAEADLRLGRSREAAEVYREALAAFAALRPATLEETWRIGLQERYGRVPRIGVETFVRLGDDASALAAAEDGQGRALAEALERRSGGAPKDSSLAGLRALLPADGAFVCYAQGLERLHAWVVRSDRVSRFDLGPTERISELAKGFRRLCAEPSPPSPEAVRAFGDVGARLRDGVWAPLAGALADCRAVTIAPGATLASLPFDALPLEVPSGAASFAEVSWAAERFAFSYVPSARILVALAGIPKGRGTGLLAVADPEYGAGGGEGFDGGTRGVVLASASRPGTIDAAEGRSLPSLPFSRVEATAVAGLVSEKERTLRLGLDANLRSLAPGSALEQARFVLLSSHGRADEEERSACGLWLSPSAPGRGAAFFPASELASRTMRADFVVLSACSTNRGRISEEEGVLSLAREFLRAGARAVLASEWLVEDASAAAVSIAFHEGVLRDGLPAGEALRRAKVRFLREAKLPVSEAARGSDPPRPRSALDPHHPFFWAPFLLFGPAS